MICNFIIIALNTTEENLLNVVFMYLYFNYAHERYICQFRPVFFSNKNRCWYPMQKFCFLCTLPPLAICPICFKSSCIRLEMSIKKNTFVEKISRKNYTHFIFNKSLGKEKIIFFLPRSCLLYTEDCVWVTISCCDVVYAWKSQIVSKNRGYRL